MVTWGVTEAGVGPAGAAGTASDTSVGFPSSLLDQLNGLRETTGERLPHPIAECYSGTAETLVVPGTGAAVEPLEFDGQYRLTTRSRLPTESFVLTTTVEASDVDDSVFEEPSQLSVRLEGPATLRPTGRGVEVRFDETGTVTVGFRTRVSARPARIQVPETVSGLAEGLSTLSVAHHTTGPSRSHPGFRDHPPLLTIGETLSVPERVEAARTSTGIEFRLPKSVTALFVAAPLAYYLGAEVVVQDRERAVLTTEDPTVRHDFSTLPEFQHEIASVLRTSFYFDCLTRRANPATDVAGVLDEGLLDADAVRSLPPDARLARYLDARSAVDVSALPDWHLSTYAEPTVSGGRSLPFLLDRLSLVYLAEGSKMNHCDLLDRSLSDNYPTRGESATRASVLEPNLQEGRAHAWMAPGTPVDAFKTMPEAFENRYRQRGRESERLEIAVVRNDTGMADEHSSAAEIYRAANLPMDVTVAERLTTRELGAVFEDRNDFVHFIGHCDDAGLRCADGHLSTDSLSESRIRTFFLNACGSYDEGLALVRGGAVAGAVTFSDVLDDHATMVGTTFARLLSRGFCIQRALELARCRIMMGNDYTVVGDGTYALVPSLTQPELLLVEETDHGYDVTCEIVTPQSAGARYEQPFGGEALLNGTSQQFTVAGDDLLTVLTEHSLPVVFEGRFHWSEDLAERL